MRKAFVVSTEKLKEEPFASVMCYPKSTKVEIEKRLKELEKLGITALEFVGRKQVCNVHVLGKGCVGIVVLACRNNQKVALKIRRTDADRTGMEHEAELLEKANSVEVGPRLVDVSIDFLLIQFVDGELFPFWLEKNPSKKRIKRVLREILEQCYQLDSIGLDHGEMSNASKHVIIDHADKPFVVDFESASLNRRPSNVTSMCQFLFLGRKTAKIVVAKMGVENRKQIVEALRSYKSSMKYEQFCRVLGACGL